MTWIGHGKSVRENRFSDEYLARAVALGEHTPTMKHDLQLVRRAVHPLAGMRGSSRLSEVDLASLTSPMLWVWGDSDAFGGQSVLERAHRALPGSKVHVVVGGGHLPWLDDPETVARVIEAHLASTPAATTYAS